MPVKTTEVVAAKVAPSRKMGEAPASERKQNLIKILRRMKATSQPAAATIAVLVANTGLTRFDVYGLISGTSGKAGSSPSCLMATGHVAVADTGEGLAVYLTKKGSATKFDEPPFVRATPAPKAATPAKAAKAPQKGKKAKES